MQNATPIDNLIEHLKGQEPFNDEAAYRLWEALQVIAGDINRLFRSILVSEIPLGNINNNNRTFTIANTPADSFIMVFKNGLLITTYIITNKVITMNTAPAINDTLIVIYKKAGI